MILVDVILFLGFFETVVLFLYSLRWNVFSYFSFNAPKRIEHTIDLKKNFEKLFISVLLPIYNEPKVIDRLLTACTSFNFPNYEIIVIDDSDDGITKEKLKKWKNDPRIKIISRKSRKGWKGGALNVGLENLNLKSTHVIVFDADFVPNNDLLTKFISRFKDGIVAVQGYQKHDLNTNENWVTKGVRVWHSMYNMIELNGKEKLGLFVPFTGGVFMVKSDLLKDLKFEEVTDEDWNLTLRLYEKGYNIYYDPELAASGECPNTFKKLLKQYSRWAEGHTRTFRKHFWKIIKNPKITLRKKMDFILTGYCFLHSIMATILMVAIVLVILFPSSTFPSYLNQIQTLLILASIPSAILASLAALFLENAKNDYNKFINAWIINFFINPFIGYAALKGLVTSKGYFNRTNKTGNLTKKIIISN